MALSISFSIWFAVFEIWVCFFSSDVLCSLTMKAVSFLVLRYFIYLDAAAAAHRMTDSYPKSREIKKAKINQMLTHLPTGFFQTARCLQSFVERAFIFFSILVIRQIILCFQSWFEPNCLDAHPFRHNRNAWFPNFEWSFRPSKGGKDTKRWGDKALHERSLTRERW